MSTTSEHEWQTYYETELALLREILTPRGYTLDGVQPHVKGERFLMQAVTTTSGRKLILLGAQKDGTRVVIKATRDQGGIHELTHEERCRAVLHAINFARDVFHTPELIERISTRGFLIVITRFIPQTTTFLERPLEEQFAFALRAFKGQEGAHATTFTHRTLVKDTFGMRDAQTYLTNFDTFVANIENVLKDDVLHTLLLEASRELHTHARTIEQYTGFLTHTDFVPHNIRIENSTLFLLDHSSLTFGNKYEGWARFLNFMTLYNQPLERALVEYVKANRTHEELESLRLMRIYRLGEIMWYYTKSLALCSGDLKVLNTERVHFWSAVLGYVLKDVPVPEYVVSSYQHKRDNLRSADEKKRQIGLH